MGPRLGALWFRGVAGGSYGSTHLLLPAKGTGEGGRGGKRAPALRYRSGGGGEGRRYGGQKGGLRVRVGGSE